MGFLPLLELQYSMNKLTQIVAQLSRIQKMPCSSATKRNYTTRLMLQKEIDLINKAKLLSN